MTYQTKSQLFKQLAVLEASGFPISRALKNLTKQYQYLEEIRKNISAGCSLSASFSACKKYFTKFDCEIIRLAEETGKLEICFKKLSDYYLLLDNTQKRIKGSLVYPSIILHLAPILLNLPQLVTGGSLDRFVISCLSFLAPFYLVIVVFYYLLPLLRSGSNNLVKLLDKVVLKIPILGKAQYDFELANFTSLLAYSLDSGMDTFKALDLVIANCNNLVIKQKLILVLAKVKSGNSLSDSLKAVLQQDYLLQSLISTGEQSGKMVEMLEKLNEYYFDSFKTTLTRFAKVFPVIIFLILAVIIAFKVISSYQSIWSGI